MQIRHFEQRDADRCIEIMHANFDLFRESSGGHIPDEIVEQRLKPSYTPQKLLELAERRVYWVVTHRRRVIGLTSLEEKGEEGEIFNTYVDSTHQRRGAGTLLRETLIAHARKRGLKKLVAKNVVQKAIHDLQEKMGFVHKPEKDKYLADVEPPEGFNERHACRHIKDFISKGGRIPPGKIDQYHFELEL